ncbi:peptidoglycan DD-metalloendopeptidase family protein [Streptomyces sp. V4-01]|uniref:Peptidoglycan DD-metalloendopeptidase family protein n=1 Tax=Actinacidiphila polyblastidii TaxID=3110430 RepID=A0ABU7P4Z7_9ACTN|nr:peptidoglycan DD-metalloendopeptidase family protein [Streptomyces sp. V4-01]
MTWTTLCTTAALTAALLTAATARPATHPTAGPTTSSAALPRGVATAAAARPAAGCTGGAGPAARCWPVTGPGIRGRPVVERGFDPPAQPWAAGHRGVDLRTAPGAPVRAAAPGAVAFTGRVAGVPVVVIALPGGLRTTYQPVRATLPAGAEVPAGRTVGTVAAVDGVLPHCPDTCLHWGLLRDDVYLDPLLLLPPSLRRAGPSRLLPVYGRT